MHKVLAALCAVCVIAIGGVSTASPLKGGFAASDSGRTVRHTEVKGILVFLVNRFAVSVSAAASQKADANPQPKQDEPESYAPTDKECEGDNGQQNADPDEGGEEKEKVPVGPEPIYFGF